MPSVKAIFKSGAVPALLLATCLGVHGQAQLPEASTPDAGRRTWGNVFPDILQDQKAIYLEYPAGLGHGKHWLPTAAVLGSIAVIAANDQFDARPFRKTAHFHSFNHAFSSTNTMAGVLAIPAATYLAGLASHNRYAESTAFLAGEAVLDGEIATEVLKLATRRARPETISPDGNFADNWFESKISEGSFPSGHTIAAFSVATVMSERYGRTHRWVPFVSYGAASAVGFSRVSLSSHYVSDVAMGAVLGYVITRYVVLRPHHE
jgi:membrane-associated phospholipid phosphatase